MALAGVVAAPLGVVDVPVGVVDVPVGVVDVPVGVVDVPVGVVDVPVGVVDVGEGVVVPSVDGHVDEPALGLPPAAPAPPVSAALAGLFFADATGTPATASMATTGISERLNRKSISFVGLRG